MAESLRNVARAEGRQKKLIPHAAESESLASRMPQGCGYLITTETRGLTAHGSPISTLLMAVRGVTLNPVASITPVRTAATGTALSHSPTTSKPLRYSLWTNAVAFVLLVALRLAESQISFSPARKATMPSNTVSDRAPE